MAVVQRVFFPGDEWIYFKIYTGIKTAEDILVTALFPLVKKMKKDQIIDQWFFIRYGDPDFHIRFRVKVKNISDIGSVIDLCNKRMKKYCLENLIRKIDISTYNRELERYGASFIEISERLFFIDSESILLLLSFLRKKDENLRWQFSIKLIDNFLENIGYDLTEKCNCLERMSENYKREFGYNMYNSKQLNMIYRERKPFFEYIFDNLSKNKELTVVENIIKHRGIQIRKATKGIHFPETNIYSYLHMTMNRLFRSKNRVHELLIYEFMYRYYKSEIAKLKYQSVVSK